MNRNRLEQILNTFSAQTILILGDLMLDEFIWGKVNRISPEAPPTSAEERNGFIQDTWSITPRWTIKAGVRVTQETIKGSGEFSLTPASKPAALVTGSGASGSGSSSAAQREFAPG